MNSYANSEGPDGETSCERPGSWNRTIRHAVHHSADISLPENFGLGEVLARIGQHEAAKRADAGLRVTQSPPSVSLIQRLIGWLRSGPALAAACAIMLVQAGIIGELWLQAGEAPDEKPEYAIVRALPGAAGSHEPFIRVSFASETTERKLRTLLNTIQADVVAGPTQLGDYFLLVPAGQADVAHKALIDSDIVEEAELVHALPGGN